MQQKMQIYNKGKVIDLVFPILSLIVCCVIGMFILVGSSQEQAL